MIENRSVTGNEVERKLEFKNSKICCPCKDDVYFGLPYRHEIAAFSQKLCTFRQLPFNNRREIDLLSLI